MKAKRVVVAAVLMLAAGSMFAGRREITVTLVSNDPALPVETVMREFKLESYTDYLARSRHVREAALRLGQQ